MLLLDTQGNEEHRLYVEVLYGHIQRRGVPVERTILPYGDVAFEGLTPEGLIMVGIELKKLHDMVACVEDGRYNMQRIGMRKMYRESYLMLEGHWKPHSDNGMLMEGFNGGINFGYYQAGRSHRCTGGRTMYSKLRRYLYSVARSGVIVCYTRDPFHTAFDICEMYHYFQKRDHTSMLEVQKKNIPTLNHRPELVRKWGDAIEGVGVKFGMQAERLFRKPIVLANSTEEDWMTIHGIGRPTARDIMRQIWGHK